MHYFTFLVPIIVYNKADQTWLHTDTRSWVWISTEHTRKCIMISDRQIYKPVSPNSICWQMLTAPSSFQLPSLPVSAVPASISCMAADADASSDGSRWCRIHLKTPKWISMFFIFACRMHHSRRADAVMLRSSGAAHPHRGCASSISHAVCAGAAGHETRKSLAYFEVQKLVDITFKTEGIDTKINLSLNEIQNVD